MLTMNYKLGQNKTCSTFSDHVGNASLKEVCHYTFYFKDLYLPSKDQIQNNENQTCARFCVSEKSSLISA